MILFFLVENCIKHGSSPDSGTPWLSVSIVSHPDILMVKVANSKPDNMPKNYGEGNGGTGLQNLKNRLAILYPVNGYEFQIDDNEREFITRLQLKNSVNEMGTKTYR
jgi:LytS/YehU family sensor histidine kinase